jgi:hypothetical protein
MAVTNWNVAPDYDEWGKDSSWDCADWIQWHKLLKAKFGKDKAKYIWEYAYSRGTQFASHYDCRTFNSDFRSYVSKEGLDPYASAGLFRLVLKPSGAAFDVVDSASDVVTGVAKSIADIFDGKGVPVIKIAIYALLLGSIGYVGYKVYQKVK